MPIFPLLFSPRRELRLMYYPLLFSSALSSSSLLFSLPISRPRKKQYRRRATPNSQAAAAVAAVAPGPFPHVRPGQRHYTSYERKNAHTHTHTHTHTRTQSPGLMKRWKKTRQNSFASALFPFCFLHRPGGTRTSSCFPARRTLPHTLTRTHTHIRTCTRTPTSPYLCHTQVSRPTP